jgi:hypothetical protein
MEGITALESYEISLTLPVTCRDVAHVYQVAERHIKGLGEFGQEVSSYAVRRGGEEIVNLRLHRTAYSFYAPECNTD